MDRVIKTIPCDAGTLYVSCDGRRVKLADCKAAVEVIETVNELPTLGKGRVIKKRYASLLLTFDHEVSYSLDFQTVDSFLFQGDFLRKDGKLERLTFSRCCLLSDLDLTGSGQCEFEIECSNDMLHKLQLL